MSDGVAEAPRADGKKPKPPLDFKHAVAGSCAGMFSKVLMQPFDLIKTRMQVSDKAHAYRGVIDAFRTIVARDGVFGLYTGLTPNLIGSGVSWGLYFFTYNAAKRNWRRWFDQEKLGPGANLLCAAQAGALSITLTNPIWMVKTRLQVQAKDPGSRPYTGLLNAFTRIVREEGPLTLYRGIGPALVLVSNGALQFMCYEELRKFVTARLPNGEKDLHSAHFMAMGACAKAFSATLTYPLQVTRSRLYQRKDPVPLSAAAVAGAGAATGAAASSSAANTAAGNAAARAPNAAAAAAGAGAAAASAAGPVSANKYRDMRHVVTHILEHENWRSFYRGLVPHLMKTAPSSAITFFGYETALRLLNRYVPAAPTPAPSSTAPAP